MKSINLALSRVANAGELGMRFDVNPAHRKFPHGTVE
jgi:hypothetical protein